MRCPKWTRMPQNHATNESWPRREQALAQTPSAIRSAQCVTGCNQNYRAKPRHKPVLIQVQVQYAAGYHVSASRKMACLCLQPGYATATRLSSKETACVLLCLCQTLPPTAGSRPYCPFFPLNSFILLHFAPFHHSLLFHPSTLFDILSEAVPWFPTVLVK
jgi:hypothetical protein